MRAAVSGEPMAPLPPQSSVVLPSAYGSRDTVARLGFRAAGPQMIRVDMAERIAHRAHEARMAGAGDEKLPVDPALVTSLGLQPQSVARLMRDLGFRESGGDGGWVWRGRRRQRPQPDRPASSSFAALAGLKRG